MIRHMRYLRVGSKSCDTFSVMALEWKNVVLQCPHLFLRCLAFIAIMSEVKLLLIFIFYPEYV